MPYAWLGKDNNNVFNVLPVYSPTLPDPTLTVENVVEVMENVAVERSKEVWSEGDIVPDPQLEEIYQKCSTEEQRIHACADIYINCNPQSSWIHLCQGLYNKNEVTAARKAKTFTPQTSERIIVVVYLYIVTVQDDDNKQMTNHIHMGSIC